MLKTVIVGASGYAGAELAALVQNHPQLELFGLYVSAGSQDAHKRFSSLHPQWVGKLDQPLLPLDEDGMTRILTQADLVVLATVSAGAEVIADGDIHIYGSLRGRALAGARGQRDARIFVRSMQAELLSIAGIWRTLEQDLPAALASRPLQVLLESDKIVMRALPD